MSSLQLSPPQAAAELLRRRRGRASLAGYAQAIEVPGKPVDEADPDAWLFEPVETGLAAHHRLLLDAVERTAARRYGRLMVFMPPGSAKSTYCSVVSPSWLMGRQPGMRVILASYGSDLAARHGRRARQVAMSPGFGALFGGATLSKATSAANEWALTNGSEYLAGGILSGITGNRAHGLFIDDPIKGREAANSKTIRDKTWAAYTDDLLTRLVPGGFVVLVQTRWHEDDLAGRLLPKNYAGQSGMITCNDGREWEVINLPAQCERDDDPLGRRVGEYLWPEWFDASHWAPFQALPMTWASLFQQRPAPPAGGFFKPDRMPVVDAVPASVVRWVRAWDLAATSDGDWTAGPKLGKLADGRYVIADVVRVRELPDERDATIKATASRDGRRTLVSLPQDPGQAGKTQVTAMARMLAGYPLHTSPESGDKAVRAEPLAGQINAGNVLMVRGEWNQALVEELRAFPYGTNDDQVDGLSRGFEALLQGGMNIMGMTPAGV